MADANAMIDKAIENANIAVKTADTQIHLYLEDIVNLGSQLTFTSDIQVESYTVLATAINNFIDYVSNESNNIPVPTNLDNYNVPDPTALPNIDTTVLDILIQEVITAINLVPDRINEALAIIDLVSGKITSDLLNGGYGIDTVDETALYEKARDREIVSTMDTVETIKVQHSQFGLAIPSGAFNSDVSKALYKTSATLSDFSRELYSKRAELFRLARQFAIEKGMQIGKELLGVTEFKITSLRNTAQTLYEELKLVVEKNSQELAIWNGKLQKAMESQKLKLGIYQAQIQEIGNRLSAWVRGTEVHQARSKNQIDADNLTLQQAVEKSRSEILEFNANVNAATAGIQALLSMYGHQVSGALSSITAVAAKIEK
jgi:hypothetical protein